MKKPKLIIKVVDTGDMRVTYYDDGSVGFIPAANIIELHELPMTSHDDLFELPIQCYDCEEK